MRTREFLLAGLLLGLATACPGALEDPESFRDGDRCPDVETEILAMKCSGMGCHTAYEPAGALDLVTPGVVDRLVNQPAAGGACAASGLILVSPEDPEASLLYLKVAGSPPCGSAMPLLADALSPKELSCLKDWIAEQAPDAGL